MPARETGRIHFIGIGGAGMSGIALVLHQRGYAVTGSDLKSSKYVRNLEEAGIPVTIGHRPETIDGCSPDVVVVSSAIPDANPELVRARELGIPTWPRAKMLSFLSAGKVTVAVAGTHGKTTTSSMIATMLDKMGLSPAFLIGGVVEGYGTNGRDGDGDYFVAEADESDGSFMFLHPHVAVVTNIDKDHLDHYGSMEALEAGFKSFMGLVGEEGHVVAMGDDERLARAAKASGRAVVTYGFGDGNDYMCHVSEMRGLSTTLSVTTPAGTVVEVTLEHSPGRHNAVTTPAGTVVEVTLEHSPGRHNALNATAAIAVADILSVDLGDAAKALSQFEGVGRRFTFRGEVNGVTIIDDYGHHPTEIAATLEAAAGLGFERVVCVFQPHRYTRTQSLMDEFGTAFDDADLLYVTDVFSAGETPIPGVSGKTLAMSVSEHGSVPVRYVSGRQDLMNLLGRTSMPGDLIVMQGAGDVTMMVPSVLERLGGK